MLGRAGRILQKRLFQLFDGAAIFLFRHVGTRKAAVPLLPFGMLAVKLLQFVDGGIEIGFVTVGISQVVANGGLIGRQSLRLVVFGDSVIETIFLVPDEPEIRVSLPECGLETNGLVVGSNCSLLISPRMQRDAEVVVGVGICGIAGERRSEE